MSYLDPFPPKCAYVIYGRSPSELPENILCLQKTGKNFAWLSPCPISNEMGSLMLLTISYKNKKIRILKISFLGV